MSVHDGIMEGGENVGGSSQSGRIVTTRHRLCQFATRPRMVTTASDGDTYVCGVIFLERGIFTHLFRLFICIGRLGVWVFRVFQI